jgi:diadenosine tetraphosphate (Ap4A) HIT family hydrolase
MEDCIFCKETNKVDTVPTFKHWYLKWDEYPVNPGHLLIISKRHISSIFQVNIIEMIELCKVLYHAKNLIVNNYKPDGMNIGINDGVAAGQSIMHLHIHIIPRYNGDVENPRGGVRGVIPGKQNY